MAPPYTVANLVKPHTDRCKVLISKLQSKQIHVYYNLLTISLDSEVKTPHFPFQTFNVRITIEHKVQNLTSLDVSITLEQSPKIQHDGKKSALEYSCEQTPRHLVPYTKVEPPQVSFNLIRVCYMWIRQIFYKMGDFNLNKVRQLISNDKQLSNLKSHGIFELLASR